MSALASASTLASVSASPLAPALACVGVDVGVDDGVGVGVLASIVPRFQVLRHHTGVDRIQTKWKKYQYLMKLETWAGKGRRGGNKGRKSSVNTIMKIRR